VVRRLRAGAPREAVADAIEAWRQERAEERLSRAAEHARTIARRLGRTDLVVVTEHDGSRLPDQDLSSLWSSFVHLVRNAVDHGIEPTEERLAKGKAGGGTITLRAFRDPEGLAIEVEDDGRGIDWREVAARARAQGLAAESHADLVEALFAEGLSTRDEATETSGRGIGLSAVRAECVRVGARLTVGAGAAGGTRLRITLPAQLIRAA
jgi:two-component system chemotaxis sensor kinase CheA